MQFTPEDFERLARISNPTGGKHTPTPWKAGDDRVGMRPETALNMADGFQIRSSGGTHGDALIAVFKHKPDRDLALYFTNVHAGMIALIRNYARAFEFIAKNHPSAPDREYARNAAEQANIYADLFCRLGKPEESK